MCPSFNSIQFNWTSIKHNLNIYIKTIYCSDYIHVQWTTQMLTAKTTATITSYQQPATGGWNALKQFGCVDDHLAPLANIVLSDFFLFHSQLLLLTKVILTNVSTRWFKICLWHNDGFYCNFPSFDVYKLLIKECVCVFLCKILNYSSKKKGNTMKNCAKEKQHKKSHLSFTPKTLGWKWVKGKTPHNGINKYVHRMSDVILNVTTAYSIRFSTRKTKNN